MRGSYTKSFAALCQEYLHGLYEDLSSVPLSQNIKHISGEILPESTQKLMQYLSLSTNDVFIDLGSGFGKVVIQFFLNSPIRKAIGIEINQDYHQIALTRQEKMQKELPIFFKERQLEFKCSDFLTMSLDEVSIVLINATCFTQQLLYALINQLNQYSNIRYIFSLRPLPSLRPFKFVRTIHLQCSWDSALGYLYVNKRA